MDLASHMTPEQPNPPVCYRVTCRDCGHRAVLVREEARASDLRGRLRCTACAAKSASVLKISRDYFRKSVERRRDDSLVASVLSVARSLGVEDSLALVIDEELAARLGTEYEARGLDSASRKSILRYRESINPAYEVDRQPKAIGSGKVEPATSPGWSAGPHDDDWDASDWERYMAGPDDASWESADAGH